MAKIFEKPKNISEFIVGSIKSIPLASLLGGMFFLIVGLVLNLSLWSFILRSVEVQVHIVDIHIKERDDGTIYLPTYEVRIPNEDIIRHTETQVASIQLHEQGDIVEGRYIASTGRIMSNATIEYQKSGGMIVMIFGVIFGAIGFAFYWPKKGRQSR